MVQMATRSQLWGVFQAALKKAGATKEEISQYTMDSMSGDYDNLLAAAEVGLISVSDTKQYVRAKLNVVCVAKPVVIGKWDKLMFCPDSLCVNSEELYLD
jgi:hypothetical protein